jgi:uncharacterized membrane protein
MCDITVIFEFLRAVIGNVNLLWSGFLHVCIYIPAYLNLLKPTGYMMHQQFNIQQLYALSTLHLCVLYLSENTQRFVLLTS